MGLVTSTPQAVQVEPLLLRVAYFGGHEDAEAAKYSVRPTLTDVAAAFNQIDSLIRAATLLNATGSTEWQESDARSALAGYSADTWLWDQGRYDGIAVVTAIEMRSPLTFVVHLAPEILGGGLLVSLVLLAERICTFRPRVSAHREAELFKGAVFSEARKELLAGRADGLALQLLREGPSGGDGRGPTQMDLIDATASGRDLNPIMLEIGLVPEASDRDTPE